MLRRIFILLRNGFYHIGEGMMNVFSVFYPDDVELPKFKPRDPSDDWKNLCSDGRKIRKDFLVAFNKTVNTDPGVTPPFISREELREIQLMFEPIQSILNNRSFNVDDPNFDLLMDMEELMREAKTALDYYLDH